MLKSDKLVDNLMKSDPKVIVAYFDVFSLGKFTLIYLYGLWLLYVQGNTKRSTTLQLNFVTFYR